MTELEQCQMIAKSLGREPTHGELAAQQSWFEITGENIPPPPPPYTQSHDAMHAVILSLTVPELQKFAEELGRVLCLGYAFSELKAFPVRMLRVSAAHKAEAYLRIKGLW